MLAAWALRFFASETILAAMAIDTREAFHAEFIKAADRLHDIVMPQIAAQIAAVLNGGLVLKTQAREVEPAAPRTTEHLSEEKVVDALARIIDLLKKHPTGFRSEQIRAELRMDKRLFQYAAHLGKTSDQLIQEGERRSTVYLLPTKTSMAQADGRVIKKKKKL